MKEWPKISEAEWEVMKVLWKKSPLPASEIIAELSGQKDWKPKTVKTLINRLVQKEALSYIQKEARRYEYYPLLDEQECVQAETRSFLQRISSAALKPIMVHFLETESLSKEDIQELQQLLKEKEQE